MNRKVVLGCLGSVVVVGLVGMALLYQFVIKPVMTVMGDLENLTEMTTMNEEVTTPDTFVIPSERVVTEEQLDRFARVQSLMIAELDAVYPELAARSAAVERMLSDDEIQMGDQGLGFREALDVLKGLGELLPAAKQAQIEALNAEGFSITEYRYVRETMYWGLSNNAALQVPVDVIEVYVEDIAGEIKDATQNQKPVVIREGGGSVVALPQSTIDMTALYADSFAKWRPFLVFGL